MIVCVALHEDCGLELRREQRSRVEKAGVEDQHGGAAARHCLPWVQTPTLPFLLVC